MSLCTEGHVEHSRYSHRSVDATDFYLLRDVMAHGHCCAVRRAPVLARACCLRTLNLSDLPTLVGRQPWPYGTITYACMYGSKPRASPSGELVWERAVQGKHPVFGDRHAAPPRAVHGSLASLSCSVQPQPAQSLSCTERIPLQPGEIPHRLRALVLLPAPAQG